MGAGRQLLTDGHRDHALVDTFAQADSGVEAIGDDVPKPEAVRRRYARGKGVVYRADADGWKVTIATEEQTAGDIALTQADGDNQVIATANNGNRHFVRKASLGGTFRISDDSKRAEADLELRHLIGRDTAGLQASFVCS